MRTISKVTPRKIMIRVTIQTLLKIQWSRKSHILQKVFSSKIGFEMFLKKWYIFDIMASYLVYPALISEAPQIRNAALSV